MVSTAPSIRLTLLHLADSGLPGIRLPSVGNSQLPRRPSHVEDERATEPVRTPTRHGARKTPFALVGGQDFVERGVDRRSRTEKPAVGEQAFNPEPGASTLFLAQSLAQDLAADTAQLAHKSYSYGEAAEAYLQVEKSTLHGHPEIFTLGLEIRLDRTV